MAGSCAGSHIESRSPIRRIEGAPKGFPAQIGPKQMTKHRDKRGGGRRRERGRGKGAGGTREEITVILETGSEIREGGFLGQPQSVRAWPAKLQEGCLADWPFEFRATVHAVLPRQTSAEIERDSYLSRDAFSIPSG